MHSYRRQRWYGHGSPSPSYLVEIVPRLMLHRVLVSFLCACALVLASQVAYAQRVSIPRQHHAWGRFYPGSWTQVRKLTEEFDQRGKLKSVSTTETKTTLIEVTDTDCMLQLEVTVEVAGKRIAAQPRTVRLGYNGESNGDRAIVKRAGEDALVVGGKKVNCQVLEATINGGDEKVLSKIYYCNTTAPFVLKRDTKSTDLEGETMHLHTLMDVIAVEMPHRVLADTKTVSQIRTIKRHAKGSTFTLEIVCEDVPGGVVAHSSKELDESGKLVRRSTLELLDYGAVDKKRLFGRGIFRRTRSYKSSVRVAPTR